MSIGDEIAEGLRDMADKLKGGAPIIAKRVVADAHLLAENARLAAEAQEWREIADWLADGSLRVDGRDGDYVAYSTLSPLRSHRGCGETRLEAAAAWHKQRKAGG